MGASMLEKIFADRPNIHSGETETGSVIAEGDTIYGSAVLKQLNSGRPSCCGIGRDVAKFIYDSVSGESTTLETGSGLSTLVFALRGSDHTTVTPSKGEVERIKEYALASQIPLQRVTFVTRSSDEYLPECNLSGLDLVLIDGKHAFPWPILDWFYSADRLKLGGILLLDDLQLASVGILRDFLAEDRKWEQVRCFRGQTAAFRKIAGSVHDVAWHMQPYLTKRYVPESRLLSLAKRAAGTAGVTRRLRRLRERYRR